MLWRAHRRWSTSQLFWRPNPHVDVPYLRPSLHSPSFRLVSNSTAAIPRLKTTSANTVTRRPGDVHVEGYGQSGKGDLAEVEGTIPTGNGQKEALELLNLIDELYAPGTSQSQSVSLLTQIRDCRQWLEILSNAEHACKWAEELAGTTKPYRAHRVLQISLSLGSQLKQNVYERVAFRLAEVKEWHLIPPLVALGKRNTGRTTARLLNWRTKALVETQHFTLLDGMLEEFSEFGLHPHRRTFHLIVQGHLLNHDVTRAGETIQKMENSGFPVDASTFAAIISVYQGLGPDKFVEDRAFEMLNHLDASISTLVLNGLIRLFLDNHDVEGALHLLDLTKSSTPKDIQNHPVGEANAETRGVDVASAADRTTYLLLIKYFAKRKNLSKMHFILHKMAEAKICPDTRIAAALVRGYFASGHEHMALSVVLDVCSSSPLDMKLLKIIGYQREVIAPAIGPYEGGPSYELFNSLLQGLLSRKGLEVVPNFLRLMQSVGLSPDASTLSVLLTYVERDRQIRPRDVIRVLKPLLSFKVRPTIRHMNTILHSIVRSEKSVVRKEGWDALGALVLRKTVSPKAKMDLTSSFSMPMSDPNLDVTSLRSRSFQALFHPVVDSLLSRSVRADRATFALRMRFDTFTRPQSDAAVSVTHVLQQMKERGLHPNAYHYAALMEAHCASGNINQAHVVLQEADSRGVLKSHASQLVLHTILITGYSRMGRPDQGLRVFQDMLNADIIPDVAAVHAIVGGFFAVKAFKLARRLLLDLWPLVAPLPSGDLRKASLKELTTKMRELRDGCITGDRFNPTSEQRQVLRRRISKIIVEWQAMSYKKDVLYPRARLRATGRVKSVAPVNSRTSLVQEISLASGEVAQTVDS